MSGLRASERLKGQGESAAGGLTCHHHDAMCPAIPDELRHASQVEA
jgi:hypothetical protein